MLRVNLVIQSGLCIVSNMWLSDPQTMPILGWTREGCSWPGSRKLSIKSSRDFEFGLCDLWFYSTAGKNNCQGEMGWDFEIH